MIELEAVCAGYSGKDVLHDVSLTFPAGTVTVLAGPNGCGKSTLLKALVGIVPVRSGTIRIQGQDAGHNSPGALAKQMAYLPQSRSVPDITVRRMVLHGRFPYLSYPRRYRPADYAAADEAMIRLGIRELAEEPVSRLSGGMRQKVCIAMALAQDTPAVLMDEPNTFLDISHQLRLMALARSLAGDGKAVVLVLHDLAMAMEYGDRLVLMRDGRIADTGTPEEIFLRHTVDDVFDIRLERLETPDGWKYYYAPGKQV